ncbi:MAG: chemotaxis response regulator protein-glutamate methylesterase [Acidobacteria bacterium]|nr:chemotaxis response regulator protein-glutamate methylesterase [Acidobacteriota bacterium]MBV8891749.1 chemotaxis response regulator protein-glutamate methylesterase [Acidobacteriota bacterium]MBV9481409.1 chemotaxis response regulator protein-glutamate methylesterase [Acidobacteriota bacterium]
MSGAVRVLVVDDSALMRKLIPQILERDSAIAVVGTAMDGNFALKKIEELRPQVITLDLEMPGLNGIDTLKAIMRKYGLPVIVVSSHTTAGASITLKALALGAFDFVAKPQEASGHMPDIAGELISKIKAAAQSKGIAIRPLAEPGPAIKAALPSGPATRVIAIGISTGGPNALQHVLSKLPGDFPGSILIVQHMPEGFTDMFARRLDESCAIRVKEAVSGDLLLAGRALVCPGNRHLKAKRLPLGEVAVLSDEPRVNGHRPSVDILFRSLAEEFGSRAVAVLMTGMGEDGASGLGEVKRAGGMTIAQSEDSCVVFGMPKAAIERGFATRVVHLDALANTLQAQCGGRQEKSARAGRD